MKKMNKHTDPVFIDILDTEGKIGKLNKFLRAANFMDPNQNKYQDLLNIIMKKIQELAVLEEIILQTRAWENLRPEDIKLLSMRGYIYARAPFFRKDMSGKEIRVLVGKETDWLNKKYPTVNDLYNYPEFLAICRNGLSRAMEMIIYENVDMYEINFKTQKA